MKRTVTAAILAAMMLTGCSYSYTYRPDAAEDDVSSDFRLPEVEDKPEDADASEHRSGRMKYSILGGKFTIEVPDDENIVLAADEEDHIQFGLDGGNGYGGSYIQITFGENDGTIDFLMEDPFYLGDEDFREYRINGRRAIIAKRGTDDPLKTDDKLSLHEQVLIDYGDLILMITSTAEENKSRDDFFRQRVIIKDIIASVKYMDEE